MDELFETLNFKSYVIGEIVFILVACLFAGLGIWSVFAIMALLCVLFPLWLIALAAWLHLEVAFYDGPTPQRKEK